jgi:hypothetical protein
METAFVFKSLGGVRDGRAKKERGQKIDSGAADQEGEHDDIFSTVRVKALSIKRAFPENISLRSRRINPF